MVNLIALQCHCVLYCRSHIPHQSLSKAGRFVVGRGAHLFIRASPPWLPKIHLSNVLSSAELSAGIVCSCMPICACLLRGHIPKGLQYLSPWHVYLSLRSRNSRRPLGLDQTHSLDNLPPHKRDSYLGTRSDDYTQLENGIGLGETKNSVMTQRERLEY